jgi:hypothetical protein
MYGIGKVDERGFLELKSSSGIINFFSSPKSATSGFKIAEDIAKIGNRMAKDSDLIESVKIATYEGYPALEVYLKEPIEPCNLQYYEHSKKYLKMNLATKDKEWSWGKNDENHSVNYEPAIGLFVFKLFGNDNETFPIGCSAFAKKSGSSYVKAHHPNVGSGGAICMGGFSGHEHMTELSVRSLANMLKNEALYSSYFKPTIVDLATKRSIIADCKTIENTIKGVHNDYTAIMARHSTVEEWL